MIVRIGFLFASDRKGEYKEGVNWYCGKDDLRVKKFLYSTNAHKATIFKTEERAKEIIAHLRKNYLPMNCPMFWTDIDLYQEYDK